MQIIPLGVLTAAARAALSDTARCGREVIEARNAVIREAQLAGAQIPSENRASKYKSPVLRITQQIEKSVEWRAAALAELKREEKEKGREKHRQVRLHNRRVETKVAKRKTRENKRRRGLPSPPHVRKQPHSSDEAAEAAAAAVPIDE